jgi:hypothetical protein
VEKIEFKAEIEGVKKNYHAYFDKEVAQLRMTLFFELPFDDAAIVDSSTDVRVTIEPDENIPPRECGEDKSTSRPSWDDAPAWAEWRIWLDDENRYHYLIDGGFPKDEAERRPIPPCECGGEAIVDSSWPGAKYHTVYCKDCFRGVFGYSTVTSARRAWRKLMC